MILLRVRVLQARYWRRLPEMTAHGLCNATFDPNVTATNLRRALSDYAAYKMALEVTGECCKPHLPLFSMIIDY